MDGEVDDGIITVVMAMQDVVVEETAILILVADQESRTNDGSVLWRVTAVEDRLPTVSRSHRRRGQGATGSDMEAWVW